MNITSAISSYVTSFFLQSIVFTIITIIVALVLYFACSKKGLTKVTAKDGKIIKFILITATTTIGLIIGLFYGTQVALTNVSVDIVDDVGKALVNQAIVQVAGPLEYNISQEVDLSNLKLLVDGVENYEVATGNGISDKLARHAFDLVKTPFTTYAKKYLSEAQSHDIFIRIAPSKIVESVWSKVMSSIKNTTNKIVKSREYSAGFWLIFSAVVSIIFLSILRFIISKVRRIA